MLKQNDATMFISHYDEIKPIDKTKNDHFHSVFDDLVEYEIEKAGKKADK